MWTSYGQKLTIKLNQSMAFIKLLQFHSFSIKRESNLDNRLHKICGHSHDMTRQLCVHIMSLHIVWRRRGHYSTSANIVSFWAGLHNYPSKIFHWLTMSCSKRTVSYYPYWIQLWGTTFSSDSSLYSCEVAGRCVWWRN